MSEFLVFIDLSLRLYLEHRRSLILDTHVLRPLEEGVLLPGLIVGRVKIWIEINESAGCLLQQGFEMRRIHVLFIVLTV